MNNNIEIHEKYIPLFKEKSRYFIMTGGRGSGKSFGVNVFLLNITYEKGHKILFSRYTMISAHTSIIPEFVEKIEMMGLQNDFRITKDEITNLKTNSSIVFKGIRTSSGNQTAALKSLNGMTTFVVDEAEELVNEDTFDKIDLSIRSQLKQNRVILILNPTTKEHWIYNRYFEGLNVKEGSNKTKKNVTYIHTTYMDNKKNLPDSFLERVYEMKVRFPEKYKHQILGGWLNKAEGTIISNWKTGVFRETELMCYGQDFGFSQDPTVLVNVSVDKGASRVYVKQMYSSKGLSASEVSRLNLKHAKRGLIICDNSEPRLTRELVNKGCNMKKTIKKKGSILSGISLMQDFEIIVDPKSKDIIKELNNYSWKDGSQTPKVGLDHFMDAIRYALTYLVQGKRSGKYFLK